MTILTKRTPVNVLIHHITEGLAGGILHLKFASICLDASREYDTLLKVCKYAEEVVISSNRTDDSIIGLSESLARLPDETIAKFSKFGDER